MDCSGGVGNAHTHIGKHRHTSQKVRDALGKASLKLCCQARQLHQFVTRTNKETGQQKVPRQRQTRVAIGQLEVAAAPFLVRDIATWGNLPLTQLCVLPAPVLNEDRVCAVWTCPGMMSWPSSARQGCETCHRWEARCHHQRVCGSHSELLRLQRVCFSD